jgi:hypothetical protein
MMTIMQCLNAAKLQTLMFTTVAMEQRRWQEEYLVVKNVEFAGDTGG